MSTITVLCNPQMLTLLAPIECSRAVTDPNGSWHDNATGAASPDHQSFHVAVYDAAALAALPDAAFETSGAFWRHTPGLQIEVRFDAAAIKADGIWSYLCERYGLSSDKNRAGAIADLAHDAGMTQIQFMNWIADNTPSQPPPDATPDATSYRSYGPLQTSLDLIRAGIPTPGDLVRVRDEVTRLAVEITRDTEVPVLPVSGPVNPYSPRWLSGPRAHVAWWLAGTGQVMVLSDLVRRDVLTGQMFARGSWRDVFEDIRWDLREIRRSKTRAEARYRIRYLADDLRHALRRGFYVAVPVTDLPAIHDRLTALARDVTDAATDDAATDDAATDDAATDDAVGQAASGWCGDYPLPSWWDGVAGTDSVCGAVGTDAITNVPVGCLRPPGHAGRHMSAFTTTFTGHPPIITCAWPGTTPPDEGDLHFLRPVLMAVDEGQALFDAVGVDAYRVRVWPARRWGARGWRVQVDSLSDWPLLGDQPLLGQVAAPWRRTRAQALALGIAAARGVHTDLAAHLPLRVHAGNHVITDPDTTGAADTTDADTTGAADITGVDVTGEAFAPLRQRPA